MFPTLEPYSFVLPEHNIIAIVFVLNVIYNKLNPKSAALVVCTYGWSPKF